MNGARRMLLISWSGFTASARKEAARHPEMVLIDRPMLERLAAFELDLKELLTVQEVMLLRGEADRSGNVTSSLFRLPSAGLVFINRRQELERLDRAWAEKRGILVVVGLGGMGEVGVGSSLAGNGSFGTAGGGLCGFLAGPFMISLT